MKQGATWAMLAVAAMGAGALTGCEDLDGRGEYLSGPEAFSWSGTVFWIAEKREMKGQVTYYKDGLGRFKAEGFPPGTKVAFGEGTSSVDEEGRIHADHDIVSALGDVSLKALAEDTANIEDVTVTLTLPDGRSLKLKMPPLRIRAMHDVFSRVTNGPVLFAEESADADASFDNVLRCEREQCFVVGGAAEFARDVDGIAVIERTKGPLHTCKYLKRGPAQDDPIRAAPDRTMSLDPAVVTVFHRRSGRKLVSQTFAASDACPYSVPEGVNTVVADAPLGKIDEWLRSLNSKAATLNQDPGRVGQTPVN